MTHADQITFIASSILSVFPVEAALLSSIAVNVRRLERFADETVANGQEEARLAIAEAIRLATAKPVPAGEVVQLSRFRRVPIRDGSNR
jgi:uncharacterized heparinase superfamily protein